MVNPRKHANNLNEEDLEKIYLLWQRKIVLFGRRKRERAAFGTLSQGFQRRAPGARPPRNQDNRRERKLYWKYQAFRKGA